MFKKYKNKIIISSLVIIGIALILLSSFDFSKKKDDSLPTLYTEALEDKIEDFLKNVDGINEAKVILTLDTSNESVYAQSSSGLDYILTSDGKPISVTEIYPTVRGVAIACTGGERDDIKIKVTELIGAYLGISSNRIKIVGID
ncbi:MAG: hypothetical protein II984_02385 [Clostridia bacterium]|nr:hypothetical protein [Clostridia bacterium]